MSWVKSVDAGRAEYLVIPKIRALFEATYFAGLQGQVMLASVVGALGSGMRMAVAAALRRPGTQDHRLCRRWRRVVDRE